MCFLLIVTIKNWIFDQMITLYCGFIWSDQNLNMRIFVSYTLKDGYLDKSILLQVKKLYQNSTSCYIDIIDNDSRDKQSRVEQELQIADALLLIETPLVMESKWVRYELEVAKNRNILIIKSDIDNIKNEICKHH